MKPEGYHPKCEKCGGLLVNVNVDLFYYKTVCSTCGEALEPLYRLRDDRPRRK